MGTFMRVAKKPIEVDAILWDGTNIEAIWDAFGARDIYGPTPENPDTIIITTLEGPMNAPKGWWIIRGVEGELYPCKPSVFDKSYEILAEIEVRDAQG
jgi:hypothetical protein